MSRSDLLVVEPGAVSRHRAAPPTLEPAPGPGPLAASVRSPVRKGYALILVFVIGFGVWAAHAPLAGGAVAPGIVSPSSSRRLVQHLEGGIIRELRVRDGDVVREGEPLIVLEPVQARAAHDGMIAQRQALLARRARLEAEKNGRRAVDFPAELRTGGELTPLAASQRQMFEARLSAHDAKRNVLRQKIELLSEQIRGYETQIANVNTQLAFIQEEIDGKQKLLDQGLMPKPEALRVRRSAAELTARRSEFETEIGKARQQIGEANLQILSADALRLDEVAAELDKVNGELAELDTKLLASEDVLKRTTIAAPASGTVVNLRFKTVGGVVQRGEPILEIVPKDDALIIEARVSPNDIQLIRPGQRAQIHFSAYSSRVMPRIDGTVIGASADRVADQSGQRAYFLARVQVDREALERQLKNITLIPGMAAEVVFVSEERTLLQYLIAPFTDVLRRGMREM